MSYRRTAPCLNCPARTVGCHSTCGKYKAFRADTDRWNRARILEAEATNATIEGVRRVHKSLVRGGNFRRKTR